MINRKQKLISNKICAAGIWFITAILTVLSISVRTIEKVTAIISGISERIAYNIGEGMMVRTQVYNNGNS